MSKVTASGTGGNRSALEAWSSRQGREPVRSGGDREEGDQIGKSRAGPGPGGGGAGWVRARGPATQVPLSPPGPCPPTRGDCHQREREAGSQLREAPSAASTPVGAAILCAKGWGKRGRNDDLWPIGEGLWQKCRKAIGLFERCQKDIVSNKGGWKKNKYKVPNL